jgi:hypothetical protein
MPIKECRCHKYAISEEKKIIRAILLYQVAKKVPDQLLVCGIGDLRKF